MDIDPLNFTPMRKICCGGVEGVWPCDAADTERSSNATSGDYHVAFLHAVRKLPAGKGIIARIALSRNIFHASVNCFAGHRRKIAKMLTAVTKSNANHSSRSELIPLTGIRAGADNPKSETWCIG
jgi:hypothetical protein